MRVEDSVYTGTHHGIGNEELPDVGKKIVYRNDIGGIIGNASGEKEYSVRVEDSVYTGTHHGIGNEELPDVGKNKEQTVFGDPPF